MCICVYVCVRARVRVCACKFERLPIQNLKQLYDMFLK